MMNALIAESYAPDQPWPKGSMGDVYEGVCEFVRSVADELKGKGAQAQDLIDAQSFIWLSFGQSKQGGGGDGVEHDCGTKPPKPEVDLDAVVADLAKAAYWPEDRARHLVALVQRWSQVLFQG